MKRPKTILFPLLLGLALLLGACQGGDGSGLGATIPLAGTFNSIQANVFDAHCIICHSGASAPQGLRLDAANSFNALVGTPSVEVPSLVRIDPGNPDGSYLLIKVTGGPSPPMLGSRMPASGPPFLSAEEIDAIRMWIEDGALGIGGSPALAGSGLEYETSGFDPKELP